MLEEFFIKREYDMMQSQELICVYLYPVIEQQLTVNKFLTLRLCDGHE